MSWTAERKRSNRRTCDRRLMATAQDTLEPSWSPVKLVHVLNSVAPDLADQLEALGSVALVAMARNRKPDGGTEREQQVMRKALVAYAGSLAAHYGYSITTQELAEAGLLPEQPFMPSDRVEEKRERSGRSLNTYVIALTSRRNSTSLLSTVGLRLWKRVFSCLSRRCRRSHPTTFQLSPIFRSVSSIQSS